MRRLLLALTLLTACLSPAQAQKKLTVDDYSQWQRPTSGVLSPDGAWMAYGITLVEGDGWLVVRRVGSADEKKLELGSQPRFSGDNRWLAFTIDVTEAERKKLEKSKKPIQGKLALLELATSEIDTLEAIQAATFSDDGRFLAIRPYPAEGAKGAGDLVVRDLSTGADLAFGNVAEFSFSEELPLLALVVAPQGKAGHGVHLVDLPRGTVRVLESGDSQFSSLRWNEDGDALGFLEEALVDGWEEPTHVAFAYTDVAVRPTRHAFDPREHEGVPEGFRIASEGSFAWNRTGPVAFLGLKEWTAKEKPSKPDSSRTAGTDSTGARADSTGARSDSTGVRSDSTGVVPVDSARIVKPTAPKKDEDLDPPGVDIWHWKDDRLQAEQQVRAAGDRRFTWTAAWHIDGNLLVRLADEDLRTVLPTGSPLYAIGYDSKPYEPTFREEWRDAYTVELATGRREKVLERIESATSSPGGRYLLYFRGGNWFTYDLATRRTANLTGATGARFDDFTQIYGREENRAFGSGMWAAGDAWVLLYDQFDIWRARPDGSKTERVTQGAADRIRHRQLRFDFEEVEIAADEPVFVSLYGDRTKDSGCARIRPGRSIETLLYQPRMVQCLSQADDAEVYLYSTQKTDESVNYHVAGADWSQAWQATNTNPQQADYQWAGSELITYQRVGGDTLQARLLYPAGYEAGKQYPMVVYIYETLSQGLHSYSIPTRNNAYNPRRLSSEGYFVLEPDITYRLRDPGVSAVESIVPAVERVLETGMVNRDQIGLTGHSWGAYQTTFVITQTDLFKGAVAGAPLTNLESMSLSVYWNTGGPDSQIFEVSQGRFPEPFWQDAESFRRNSPVHNMTNARTPLLVAFGDKDGSVEFNQGIELYNTMRRMQKPFVLLVYEGENHGLAKKENQIDYANRLHEWFDHYLRGAPPASWITEGLPFREKELEKKKQKDAKAAAGR